MVMTDLNSVVSNTLLADHNQASVSGQFFVPENCPVVELQANTLN
jgi:hypothetical protein